MRRVGTTLMVLALATIGRAEESRAAEVVRSNNRFALDLYGRLRERPGNLFFSPASISSSLAMTYAGARGETAEQMAATLHFDLSGKELHAAFASLGKALNAGDPKGGYRLSVANRLWGQQGYHFLPEFLAVTRESYGAELAQVDFAQAEPARRRINQWVEQQTRGRIRDLIPPDLLDAQARLVLANAIYFKGSWTEPFRERATQDAPFRVAAGTTVSVPLMYRHAGLRFWSGDGLKALELPYKGDLAMVVLLPDETDGLSALEAKLSEANLGRWLSTLRRQEVRVHLPRFRMESQFQLADALQAMGMTRAFDPDRADFSGMSTQEQLSLSAVIHKAFVEVNEEGTEAAAATAALKTEAAAPARREEAAVFRTDHPFVFLIRDTRSGIILFLGRVANPRS